MSGKGTTDRKAGARDRARRTAQARARRKARFARNAMRPDAGHLKQHDWTRTADKSPAPLPAVAVAPSFNSNAAQSLDIAITFPPVLNERAPRFALAAGAAAIAAIALLTPATRPQWLTLIFAPQTRVADVAPRTLLTPQAPLGEAQALASLDAKPAEDLSGGQSGNAAGPPPLAQAGPGEGPPPAPARNEQKLVRTGPVLDAAEPRVSGMQPGLPEAVIRSAPVTGAITALAAYDAGDGQRAERMARCEADFSIAGRGAAGPIAPVPRESFGKALAEAALQQTRGFGVYTDSYRKLAFPLGDVPALFGVCTDVVIRAYRALGIDLQARVHTARVGAIDASIAHRRTYTLRRYFASRGASLPISDFAEDYLPGDIVTYYRPQNSGSKDHIAIVADQIGPSGRPMIIHNRGWGAQLEDALFVDKITGHYRYAGAEPALSKIRAARVGRQAKPGQIKP